MEANTPPWWAPSTPQDCTWKYNMIVMSVIQSQDTQHPLKQESVESGIVVGLWKKNATSGIRTQVILRNLAK